MCVHLSSYPCVFARAGSSSGAQDLVRTCRIRAARAPRPRIGPSSAQKLVDAATGDQLGALAPPAIFRVYRCIEGFGRLGLRGLCFRVLGQCQPTAGSRHHDVAYTFSSLEGLWVQRTFYALPVMQPSLLIGRSRVHQGSGNLPGRCLILRSFSLYIYTCRNTYRI